MTDTTKLEATYNKCLQFIEDKATVCYQEGVSFGPALFLITEDHFGLCPVGNIPKTSWSPIAVTVAKFVNAEILIFADDVSWINLTDNPSQYERVQGMSLEERTATLSSFAAEDVENYLALEVKRKGQPVQMIVSKITHFPDGRRRLGAFTPLNDATGICSDAVTLPQDW